MSDRDAVRFFSPPGVQYESKRGLKTRSSRFSVSTALLHLSLLLPLAFDVKFKKKKKEIERTRGDRTSDRAIGIQMGCVRGMIIAAC